MLSTEERVFIVLQMAEMKSVILVQRAWRRKFHTPPPTDKTITATFDRFVSTGSVQDLPRSGRPRDEDKAVEIERYFNQNPSASTRKAAQVYDVSHTTVHKALKVAGMKAYKIHHTQALYEDDYAARQTMCEQLVALIDDNNLENLCFSDEATFHTSGHVHKHNFRLWDYENPHAIHQVVHQSPKVNVWCALRRGQLFGPYFFEGTVTADKYQHMLEHYFLPQLSRRQKASIIFQQDGAPPHWGLHVRTFLNEKFPNRWIGRDGPFHWAARSPDLTPLDFFLWGFVKTRVYRPNTVYNSIEELQNEITSVLHAIDGEMLQRVFDSLRDRYILCMQNGGGHMEQFD